MRIAITGSLASGKSAVLGMIKKAGFPVGSCDNVVRQILSNPGYCQKVLDILGIAEMPISPAAIRQAIADIIFEDAKKRGAYLDFLYPIVESQMKEEEQAKPAPAWFWEVPMLFEAGWHNRFDKVLVVVSDRDLRQSRAAARGVSHNDFERRDRLQLDDAEKARRADFVIENNGGILDLEEKVERFLSSLGILKEEQNG